MSSELKQALKEANTVFRAGEAEKAAKICKGILKKDAGNYMAHVLLGAIYQNTSKEEAANYLRKAVSLSKEPISALQGLAQCVPDEELPGVLENLLDFTPNKYEEIYGKLLKAGMNLQDVTKIVKIFEKEISLEVNDENRKRIEVASLNLSELLIRQKDAEEKWTNPFYESLIRTIHIKDVNQQERYRRLLATLYKTGHKDVLVERAVEMHVLFINDHFPLEWLCKIYLESYESSSSIIPEKILTEMPYFIDNLLEKCPKSTIGQLTKALLLFHDQKILESREMVINVLQEAPNWSAALKILIKIYFVSDTYALASQILENLGVEDLILAECYIQQDIKLQKALEICSRIVDTSRDDKLLKTALILKVRTELGLEISTEDSLKYLEKLEYSSEIGYLNALSSLRTNKDPMDVFESIRDLDFTTVDALLLKAQLLFKLEKYFESLSYLLKALNNNPTSSRVLYWLSEVYEKMEKYDLQQEHLERCLQLNPIYREGILKLCSIYKSEGNLEKVEKLLLSSSVHAKDVSLKWIWLYLGLHYISVSENFQAINTFRTVLRFDKEDYLVLEALADAYFNNGSYNSALKIYSRIVSETDDNIYCKYQVGNIRTVLGHYNDAIKCFGEILENDPKYVPALKGLAEAHYSQAKALERQRRLGSVRDHLQKAILNATMACELKAAACHWNLLATLLLKVGNLPENLSRIEVRTKLFTQTDDNEVTIILSGDEIYELSSRCYLRALKESPRDTMLWYNLATCMYWRAAKVSDKAMMQEYLEKAQVYAKQSIATKPSRWQNWNLMGVISVRLGVICQALHCFVKCLRLNKTSAVAWSNLGLMYLQEGEKCLKYDVDEGESREAVMMELRGMANRANRSANKAFAQAQQSNTEYLNAWIGQAITAERMDREDAAMDLFRHCTQLGYHAESAIGYSRFVCSIINNLKKLQDPRYRYSIENMHALSRAHDSITWFLADEDEKVSVEALCLAGCLSYRAGLFEKAAELFDRALAKNSPHHDIIACNLAFCRVKQAKFPEAIVAFEKVKTPDFRSSLGLAYSYFKDEQYEKSYQVYEALLQLDDLSELEQATILIAMSSMIYAFHSESDTKEVLYQL
ncbi:tetratricopeptide repeat protein 37 [Sergentomyia squamirostris]